MKRFDIKKALMGWPVVSRAGLPISIILDRDDDLFGIDCFVNGSYQFSCTNEGRYFINNLGPSMNDLFLI